MIDEKQSEAIRLEKELIDKFMSDFNEKAGYYPTVVGKYQLVQDKHETKHISLQTLDRYFEIFVRELYTTRSITLMDKWRYRPLVELRSMYMFLARLMKYTFVDIAKYMNRDHTSIIHGVHTFRNMYETDEMFRQKYFKIVNYIKNESSTVAKLDKMEFEPKSDILA